MKPEKFGRSKSLEGSFHDPPFSFLPPLFVRQQRRQIAIVLPDALMRNFVYKLTSDDGGAPCVYDGVLTLAICKPMIRAAARKRDWLFGFGGKSKPMSERLIYIAEVTDVFADAKYYSDGVFRTRPDCIYQMADGRLRIKPNARYHADGNQLIRNVGDHPDYKNATVLLSSNFRYFGIQGDCSYQQAYPRIAQLLRAMTQGHRVNHGLDDDLRNLQWEIWGKFQRMKIGEATQRQTSCSIRAVVCQTQKASCGS
jgi:Nucleotide modification associated domain 2